MFCCALTVAGSDPSGGAGIQADIKTFSAHGVYGLSILTSLTAQGPSGVKEIYPVPPFFLRSQLEALAGDFQISAMKIGMLYQKATIKELAKLIRLYGLKNIVLDTIVWSGSGAKLLQEGGIEALKEELLPHATIVTPNLEEAGLLINKRVTDLDSMKEAAYQINKIGPQYVLIKGGHLEGDIKDIFFDGKEYTVKDMLRKQKNVHGTGCTLSAVIAAGLAKGLSPHEAVSKAQEYTQKVIHNAYDFGGDILYPNHKLRR